MPIRVGTQPILKMYAGPNILPTWSPADFTNVQYWWRADLGVTESGGSVTVWEDQINAYQLINGSGATPTKTTEAGLNGAAVIDFDGSTDFVYATTPPASRTGDFTLLGVYYIDDPTVNDSIFGVTQAPASSTTQFLWRSVLGRSEWYTFKFDAAGGSSLILQNPGTIGAHAVKGRYDASAPQIYGALDTLTETAGTGGGNTNQNWDLSVTFSAGAWVQGTAGTIYAGRYFNGKIAEMVMIYDNPGSTEMNEWKTYVNNKYGTIIV